MKRAGIHHIGLATHTAEETIKFYTEITGRNLSLHDKLHPAASPIDSLAEAPIRG
jgi:catechol 2,3-dioxygenase-like lactoylglutathione lyase family enzyme